ncbi:MAG: GNAT family N-acetyltransferase [Pseudomonadales bacterium]
MIRPARESDLPRIAEIHAEAWHYAYSNILSSRVLATITPEARLPVWKEWFAEDSYDISVYLDQNKPMGFILICPAREVATPPPNYAELSHLYIDPKHIGHGVGHLLFQEAVSQIQSKGYEGMLLWTLEHNTVAREFYESHNMEHDGTRQDEPEWLGPGIYEVRYLLKFSAN